MKPVPVFVVNAVSLVPSEFKRTIRLTVTPLKVVKNPPITSLPSDWIAIERTLPLKAVPVFVVNTVSLVPSVFKRTIRLTAVPLKLVKSPPATILPSDWIAIENTVLLKPVPVFVVNAVSLVPSEFKRTIRLTVTPLKVVKIPIITILPSDWIAIEFTEPLKPVPVFVVKEVSSVPSEFRRAMWGVVAPLKFVKAPPATILPSD